MEMFGTLHRQVKRPLQRSIGLPDSNTAKQYNYIIVFCSFWLKLFNFIIDWMQMQTKKDPQMFSQWFPPKQNELFLLFNKPVKPWEKRLSLCLYSSEWKRHPAYYLTGLSWLRVGVSILIVFSVWNMFNKNRIWCLHSPISCFTCERQSDFTGQKDVKHVTVWMCVCIRR